MKISASISLEGVTVADFTSTVQAAFKTTVANLLSGVSASQVIITSYSRRSLAVDFDVYTGSTSGSFASSLSKQLTDGLDDSATFTSSLNANAAAAGATGFQTTGVKLTSPIVVTAPPTISSSSSGMSIGLVIGIIVICCACLFIVVAVLYFTCARSKHHDDGKVTIHKAQWDNADPMSKASQLEMKEDHITQV